MGSDSEQWAGNDCVGMPFPPAFPLLAAVVMAGAYFYPHAEAAVVRVQMPRCRVAGQ